MQYYQALDRDIYWQHFLSCFSTSLFAAWSNTRRHEKEFVTQQSNTFSWRQDKRGFEYTKWSPTQIMAQQHEQRIPIFFPIWLHIPLSHCLDSYLVHKSDHLEPKLWEHLQVRSSGTISRSAGLLVFQLLMLRFPKTYFPITRQSHSQTPNSRTSTTRCLLWQ